MGNQPIRIGPLNIEVESEFGWNSMLARGGTRKTCDR
jgi:hypothetical protein